VRNADWRLTEREAVAVREWERVAERDGSNSAIVHCIRDHKQHIGHGLVEGLWGGRPKALRKHVNPVLIDFLRSADKMTSWQKILDEVVWPSVARNAFCHDSVSPCDRKSSSSRHPFTVARTQNEFIGQSYNEHQLSSTEYIGNSSTIDVIC